MAEIRSTLRVWWRSQVDYRWLVDTLASHSALGLLRFLIGAGGLGMLLITVLTWMSNAAPADDPAAVVGCVLAGSWALRWWLLPWPREVESVLWVVVIDVYITAHSVLLQDRLVGAWGIVMLVTIGGYVTMFHGSRILVLHLGWSLFSILLLTTLLVLGGLESSGPGAKDIALGVAIAVCNLVVTCVVLPSVQICHWLLRLDTLSDPLTKLWNRRGLDSRLARIAGHRFPDGVYIVALDLDRFKSVNDSFGHLVGDEVLVRTAESLRAAAPARATVARTGGEEFAIVGSLGAETIDVLAERLRNAVETIPGLPMTITASVGAAICEPATAAVQHLGQRHQSLFHRADSAMYQAKQQGGNTVVIAA